MVVEEVRNVLKEIGLTNNEASIYLDLLQYGKSSAMTIAKRTLIHRPNVYDSVEKLIEKGLVFQTIEEERKVFNPVNPNNLFKYIKQKEMDLKKIIPELDSLRVKEQRHNEVIGSEGLNGVRTAIFGLLESKQEIYSQGFPIEMHGLLGGFMMGFHQERAKKKIKIKQIIPSEALEEHSLLTRVKCGEMREYDSKNPSETSLFVNEEKVIIISWTKPIFVVEISNKFIVDKFRMDFLEIWKSAKMIKTDGK